MAGRDEVEESRGEGIRYASSAGKWILVATVLGAGLTGIDATVINVALPTIGRDLHLGFTGLQWTVNAYTLALAALLLLGGSLGDRLGRRRLFVIGVTWFGLASAACGLAPSGGALIAARALQGVGGALLTPSTLAIIEASFAREDRPAAIGAWSGLVGVATAIGPLIGGYLVQTVSWRLAFLINPPLAAIVIWLARRRVPETRDPDASPRVDLTGAALAAAGLGLVAFALTGGPGTGNAVVERAGLGAGLALLAAFVAVEATSPGPMLPLEVFRSAQFSTANLITFIMYGAVGGVLFLLPIELQSVVGFTPVAAGLSLLPVTLILLLLSARVGRLAGRIGPRLPMTVGPIVAGLGLVLMVRIGSGSMYLTDVMPGVVVLGLGFALTVAPLTATVLGAVREHNAGVASAVNNDVARAAGLVAVAVLPLAAGIAESDYARPVAFSNGFHSAVVISGILCCVSGLIALIAIRRQRVPQTRASIVHCPISAPPLQTSEPGRRD